MSFMLEPTQNVEAANYGNDFRTEAVNLLLSSGRPLKRVAEELGISANSMRKRRGSSFDATL